MGKGIFLEPGQGTIYSARGSKMAFKALHKTTGGAFSFMERELPVSNQRPSLTRIKDQKASMSWKVPLSSSSEEKVEKEVPDFGQWHQAASRTRSATLATFQRDY